MPRPFLIRIGQYGESDIDECQAVQKDFNYERLDKKKVSAESVSPLRALTTVSTKLYWIRMENRFFGGHSSLIMPSRKCAFSFVNFYLKLLTCNSEFKLPSTNGTHHESERSKGTQSG